MAATLAKSRFVELAESAGDGRSTLVIPLAMRLLSDQLTPVLAYRRLVAADERTAPSFLLESVEGGSRIGRYSILGAHPVIEVLARAHDVRIRHHRTGASSADQQEDPLLIPASLTAHLRLVMPTGADRSLLPGCLLGGWVGYAAYDTVRYAEPEKLGFESAPPDDRNLPDLHFGYYDEVVVFDQATRIVHLIRLVEVGPGVDPGRQYDEAMGLLRETLGKLQTHSKPLPAGLYDPGADGPAPTSNMSESEHATMVERAREYIRAGDIFQVVVGQRFERRSKADPFDVYRALRTVNPSPYMVYLQAEGCILVASSPEILCRVRHDEATGKRIVTNRPLAGTRRRGATPDEDHILERELLADDKERSEHVMLVDLGRNDIGQVCKARSVDLPAIMEIEHYSHVMHISSTVTGELRDELTCWDALRATLPVGTISGAPKIRAMQIIDELEPVRRGPYGGGFGYVSLNGDMDIALALRTMVIPTALRSGPEWVYHIQAAGGIVADSKASAEYQETVNKAAAMVRAIDVAESAFAEP